MECSKKVSSVISTFIIKTCMLLIMALPLSLLAQTYDSLNALTGHKAKLYYSNGAAERAKQIGARIDRVYDYYDSAINFKPAANLLILSPVDWNTYCAKGAVYGIPHYTGSQTLVVASEDNPFWKSFTPPTDKLPKEIATQVIQAYSDKAGNLSMQPFFDLLAIHEFAHAYHNQAKLKMQRKWMGELFANILLHTYIAERDPAQLPALTAFPQLVIKQGKQDFAYTTLTDFEEKYDDIARKSPRNYGWYQCRLHAAAADIYNAGGPSVIKKLWVALQQKNILTDDEFVAMLAKDVHQSVADVFIRWDEK